MEGAAAAAAGAAAPRLVRGRRIPPQRLGKRRRAPQDLRRRRRAAAGRVRVHPGRRVQDHGVRRARLGGHHAAGALRLVGLRAAPQPKAAVHAPVSPDDDVRPLGERAEGGAAGWEWGSRPTKRAGG